MTDKIFLDTNLWVYLFSDQRTKQENISRLISENFKNIWLSAQVLGELFNVITKKEFTPPEEAVKIVRRISAEFPVSGIDKATVKRAMDLKLKYHYSYWDSLIIAAALGTHCKRLYTEDLQHKQVIENGLIIINPFK